MQSTPRCHAKHSGCHAKDYEVSSRQGRVVSAKEIGFTRRRGGAEKGPAECKSKACDSRSSTLNSCVTAIARVTLLGIGGSMKRSLLMGSLLLAAVSAYAQPQSQNQRVIEEIRKVDRERIQAQVNADSVALNRIYADDFIGIGPSGTVRTKKEVLADFASGSLKFQSITTDDVRIRVYGNAAVETGLSTMKGQDADKVVPEENRFTRVWIKQGGRWRLVANHYSNLVKGH